MANFNLQLIALLKNFFDPKSFDFEILQYDLQNGTLDPTIILLIMINIVTF